MSLYLIFFFWKNKTVQGTSYQLIYVWVWIDFDLIAFISKQPHKSFNELGGHTSELMEQSETRTGNINIRD